MTDISSAHALRQAARLAATYGFDLPAEITDATANLAALRAKRSELVASRSWDERLVADVLSAQSLDKGLATAMKTRREEADRLDLLELVLKEAERRTYATIRRHDYEIADAVLASDVLGRAFTDLTDAVAGTPSTTPLNPTAKDGEDTVIAAARIRKAFAAFEGALSEIESATEIRFGGTAAEGGPAGLARRRIVSLAIASVDYSAAKPAEVDKALKGIVGLGVAVTAPQFGPDGRAYPTTTFPGTEERLAPVLLHNTQGVTLARVTSVDELEERIEKHTAAFRGSAS